MSKTPSPPQPYTRADIDRAISILRERHPEFWRKLIEREMAPTRDNGDIWYWIDPKLKSEGFDYEGLSMHFFVFDIRTVIIDDILPALKNTDPAQSHRS